MNHKGRNRHFITEAEVEAEQEKERKDKEWRVKYLSGLSLGCLVKC